jgi:hypothetical protein
MTRRGRFAQVVQFHKNHALQAVQMQTRTHQQAVFSALSAHFVAEDTSQATPPPQL